MSTITLALFLLLPLIGLWFLLRHKLLPASEPSLALHAQLDAMLASFDSYERETTQQDRQWRNEERQAAIARGEVPPPKPRQPKATSSAPPRAKKQSKIAAPFAEPSIEPQQIPITKPRLLLTLLETAPLRTALQSGLQIAISVAVVLWRPLRFFSAIFRRAA